MGPEAKNDTAGEGQQQFTGLDSKLILSVLQVEEQIPSKKNHGQSTRAHQRLLEDYCNHGSQEFQTYVLY
jgi:hypothetical protein